MDEDKRQRTRANLYIVGGVYLLYLAYKLFSGRAEMSGTELTVSLCAAAVFAVAGVLLIVWGVRGMRRTNERGKEDGGEDGDSPS